MANLSQEKRQRMLAFLETIREEHKDDDEVLIALSVSAATNPLAKLALQQIPKLKGMEAHATVILKEQDESVFKKFGINITCEPKYQTKKLYHK